MAVKVSKATGSWSSASTWMTADATSYQDIETDTGLLTTSYVLSSTFTPGAITVSHLAMKVAYMNSGSPTGTWTVALDQGGGTVAGTEVAINLSDIPGVTSSGYIGWIVFKLAAPVTLLAATAYSIKAKTSSSSMLRLYCNSTANNWSRMLLDDATTGAPGSGDQWHVLGEKTGAGTGNNFTVTMDNTATTSFGPTVSGGPPQGATIGHGGTLSFGTSASTNYYLKQKGIIACYQGSTWNIGSSGTRIPSTSTAVVEFDCVANVDSGIQRRGGNLQWFGDNARLRRTTLSADEAAAQTVISLTATTGWSANDVLCFTPTSTTYNQYEKQSISTVDSATQVTLSAGLTYAHSGTSPTICYVGNLTSNVKVRSVSSTNRFFFDMRTNAVTDAATSADTNSTFDNIEFYDYGSSTSNKLGIEVATQKGGDTTEFIQCTFWQNTGGIASAYTCLFSSAPQASGTGKIDRCVAYNITQSGIGNFGGLTASGAVLTVTDNLVCGGSATNNVGLYCCSGNTISGGTYTATGNVISGLSTGTSASLCGMTLPSGLTGGTMTINSNIVSCCQGNGVGFGNGFVATAEPCASSPTHVGSMTVYYCDLSSSGTAGVTIGSTMYGLVASGWEVFGTGRGISFSSSVVHDSVFRSMTINGTSGKGMSDGLYISVASKGVIFEDCDFSTVSGIKTACTRDVSFNGTAPTDLVFRNTKLGASTEILSYATYLTPDSYIGSEKHDQTAGNHRFWMKYGTGIIETSIYKTASPSLRLTPNSATYKLRSTDKARFVANAGTLSPVVWVARSQDTAYNGNQPRLIVKRNSAVGISSDTTLATAVCTLSNGTFTGAATGWTLGSGWAYSSNTVVKNADGTATLSQAVGAASSKVFCVIYTISSLTVGDVTVAVGGTSGTLRNADGTYREEITCSGTGDLTFTPSNTARFTIDNVYIFEKLTGTTASVTDDGVLRFYVDCDGSAGYICVDDWSF